MNVPTNCCLTANVLPEDFYGTLTYEAEAYLQRDETLIPEGVAVKVFFTKGNAGKWYDGVIDLNNQVIVTIPEQSFFSTSIESKVVVFRASDNERIIFKDEGDFFDCVGQSFLPKICQESAIDYFVGLGTYTECGDCAAKGDPLKQYLNETRGDDRYYLKPSLYTKTEIDTLLSEINTNNPTSIYPEDFGAVGDGDGPTPTDDSEAFNDMFQWIRDNSSINGYVVELLPNKNYRIDDKVVIGDTGNRLTIIGNGATISTRQQGTVIFSWDPNDTYIQNGRTEANEAKVYVTKKVFVDNIYFDAGYTADTTALRIWGCYGATVTRCFFRRFENGLDLGWALMTNVSSCFGLQNTGHSFMTKSAGVDPYWPGISVGFGAGNGCRFVDCQVFNELGAPSSFYVNSCDNIQFINCIAEGANPEVAFLIEDISTNTKQATFRNCHVECNPDIAVMKVFGANSSDLHIVIDQFRCHYPDICVIDTSEGISTVIEFRSNAYRGSGQYYRARQQDTYIFKDSSDQGYMEASSWDLISGETPRISVRNADNTLGASNFSFLNTLFGEYGHIVNTNFDIEKNQYLTGQGVQQTAMAQATGVDNVSNLIFSEGTGHVEFPGHQVSSSQNALTISFWASCFASLKNFGGPDPIMHWLSIGNQDSDKVIGASRWRSTPYFFFGSNWGHSQRLWEFRAGPYDIQARLNHFCIVLDGSSDPVLYWNGVNQNALGRFVGIAGSRYYPNKTRLGSSFYHWSSFNGNFGDTPMKLSIFEEAKDQAGVQALYNGGVGYDDTADAGAANLVLSASNNFNGITQSEMFADASTVGNDGVLTNFKAPYTPVQVPGTSDYELLSFYRDKTWYMEVDSPVNISIPEMRTGIVYELYLKQLGGGSVTITQNNSTNYLSDGSNYNFVGGGASQAINLSATIDSVMKLELILLNGVLIIREITI